MDERELRRTLERAEVRRAKADGGSAQHVEVRLVASLDVAHDVSGRERVVEVRAGVGTADGIELAVLLPAVVEELDALVGERSIRRPCLGEQGAGHRVRRHHAERGQSIVHLEDDAGVVERVAVEGDHDHEAVETVACRQPRRPPEEGSGGLGEDRAHGIGRHTTGEGCLLHGSTDATAGYRRSDAPWEGPERVNDRVRRVPNLRPGRTTAVLAIGSVTSMALLTGSAVLNARGLGPDARGELAVQLVFVSLALSLLSSGIALAGRVLLVVPDDPVRLDDYLGLAVAASGGVALIALIGGPIALRIIDVDMSLLDVLVLALYGAAVAFAALSTQALAAYGFLRRMTAAEVLGALVGFGLTILAFARGAGEPHVYLGALLVGSIVQCVAAAALMEAAGVPVQIRLRPESWRPLLRRAVPGSVFTLAQTSAYRLDRYVIAILLSPRAAGIYSVAATTSEVIRLGPWAASQLVLFRYASTSTPERVARQVRLVGMALTAGAATVAAALAPFAVPALFGSDYHAAVRPLQLLVFGEVALCSYAVDAHALIGMRRVRTAARASLLGLIVVTILDVALIPSWTLYGAAIASVVGYTVMAVIAHRAMKSAGDGLPDAPNDGARRARDVAAQWDKAARPAVLDPRRIAHGRSYFHLYERALADRIAALPHGHRAIDLGCGSGRDLVHLAATSVIDGGLGIDVSPGSVEGACSLRASCDVPASQVEFAVGTFDSRNATGDHDLILSVASVNYAHDLRRFFDVLVGLAAPGAAVLVTDHQHPPLAAVDAVRGVARRLARRGPRPPSHLVFHDARSVLAAAEQAGFVVEHVDYAGFATNWLLADGLYELWRHPFRRAWTRWAARATYDALASIVSWEDRRRRESSNGRYYFVRLRWPSAPTTRS